MKHFVVPITDLDVTDRRALAHAGSVRREEEAVLAVHVMTDASTLEALRTAWVACAVDAELIVLEAPSAQVPRVSAGALVAYVDALSLSAPVTVIVSEGQPGRRAPTHSELCAALAAHPRVAVETATSMTECFQSP